MAFSTTDDEQWFTALPVDPDAASAMNRQDATRRLDDTNEAIESAGSDTHEKVVTLPAPSSGPQWAAALDHYTPGSTTPPGDSDGAAAVTPAARLSWIRRHRSSMAVTGSVAALIALVGGAAMIVTGTGEDQQATAAVELSVHPVAAEDSSSSAAATSTAEVSSDVPQSAEQWCAGQNGGTRAVASSTDPDLAAIARIEDAYYLTRDINAVNTQLGGGVVVEPADFAAAMAAIPAGTDHCVLTSPLAAGQYRVTVIERRPSGEEKRFTSAMTVRRAPDDKTSSIVGIGQVPQ
ncbi:hypothetical protein [Rhodococcoides fascians]|uniref:hypothetical protein n=1 Tax=Rhodococcoides fascians TaxID=1828 RepID=UPI00055F7862|nr:hypothetical protein [Rhodococcus fascians]